MDTNDDPDDPAVDPPGRHHAPSSHPTRPLLVALQQPGQRSYQPTPTYNARIPPEPYGAWARGPFDPAPLAQCFVPQQNPADASFQQPINENTAHVVAPLPLGPTYPPHGLSGAGMGVQHCIPTGASQDLANPSTLPQICSEYVGDCDFESLCHWNSTVKPIGAPSGTPHAGWPADPDTPTGDINTTSRSQGTALPPTIWDGYAWTGGFSGGSSPPDTFWAQLDRLDDYSAVSLEWSLSNQHPGHVIVRTGIEAQQRELGEVSSESETDDSTTLVSSPCDTTTLVSSPFDTILVSPLITTGSAPSPISSRLPTAVPSTAPTESAPYGNSSAAAQGSTPESSLATDKTYRHSTESEGGVRCPYPNCVHTTNTPAGMRRHFRTKHTPVGEEFSCPVGCGRRFVGGRLDRVKNHLESAACKGSDKAKVNARARLDAIRRSRGAQAALDALKIGLDLSS